MMLKYRDGIGVGTGRTGSEYGLEAGCSQYGDELRGKEFLQQLGEDRALRRTLPHGVHLHILQMHHYRVSMTHSLSTYDAIFAPTFTYSSVIDESNLFTL
jgi:hypothetical protein